MLQSQSLKLWKEEGNEGGGSTTRLPHLPSNLGLPKKTHLCLQKADGEQEAAVNKALDSGGKTVEVRMDTQSSLNS